MYRLRSTVVSAWLSCLVIFSGYLVARSASEDLASIPFQSGDSYVKVLRRGHTERFSTPFFLVPGRDEERLGFPRDLHHDLALPQWSSLMQIRMPSGCRYGDLEFSIRIHVVHRTKSMKRVFPCAADANGLIATAFQYSE